MAKIILNANYVDSNDVKQTGKYLFDAEDGTAPVQLVVWLEKSKATDKHPDGKPWIKLPKDNPTNRVYYSEDLFAVSNVNGEVSVETKTTPPRILGTTGVKQDVLKYLDPDTALEYTTMVEQAINDYAEAKANAKKKPEEMDAEELEEYIAALRAGVKYTANAPKSFLDMFNDEDYDRYNEILALAAENKANAPKAPRQALTEEEKAIRAKKRQQVELSKAEALLAALLASVGSAE